MNATYPYDAPSVAEHEPISEVLRQALATMADVSEQLNFLLAGPPPPSTAGALQGNGPTPQYSVTALAFELRTAAANAREAALSLRHRIGTSV